MSGYRRTLANSRLTVELYEKNLPREMRELPNWVAFKSQPSKTKIGKYDKVLLNPNLDGENVWAKSNEPSTWASYEKAKQYALKNNCQGVAFALEKDKGICCVDLDGCIGADGKINEVAKSVLKRFGDTYCEKSISGKGLHIFCKGELPEDFNQRNEVIEMYNDKRFISMTGTMLKYSKSYLKEMKKLTEINKELLGEKEKIVPAPRTEAVDRSERFIIDKLKSHQKYGALYSGDVTGFSGDSSRADLALCMGIAFYSKDETTIDNVFRSSGLYREKWDKGCYAKITVDKALRFQSRSYDPKEYYGKAQTKEKPTTVNPQAKQLELEY